MKHFNKLGLTTLSLPIALIPAIATSCNQKQTTAFEFICDAPNFCYRPSQCTIEWGVKAITIDLLAGTKYVFTFTTGEMPAQGLVLVDEQTKYIDFYDNVTLTVYLNDKDITSEGHYDPNIKGFYFQQSTTGEREGSFKIELTPKILITCTPIVTDDV